MNTTVRGGRWRWVLEPRGAEEKRSYWYCLVALVLVSPWPGLERPSLVLAGTALVLLGLARPQGRAWLPWLALAVSLIASVDLVLPEPTPQSMSRQLEDHCRGLRESAEELAADPQLEDLFAASGEALDPATPFRLLQKVAGRARGRTAYLADDFGRLVAWGGDEQAYPTGVRPLGLRQSGVEWSAGRVMLYFREPIFLEGRLVGAVTVADGSELVADRVFGIVAPHGRRLGVGLHHDNAVSVAVSSTPGVELPVAILDTRAPTALDPRWVGWLLFGILALALFPQASCPTVACGGLAFGLTTGGGSPAGVAIVMLLAAAAVGRTARTLPLRWARALVILALALAALASIWIASPMTASWLPRHLLRPGWGGVWMVVAAWMVAGWPANRDHRSPSLGRRLAWSTALALVAVILAGVRFGLALHWAATQERPPRWPGARVDLSQVLPQPPERCALDDLAPVLALRWGLDQWSRPSELRLLDSQEREVSRWGDLGPAGAETELAGSWEMSALPDFRLELRVASGPWALLADWRSGEPREAPLKRAVWFAVMSRSGVVAASLHPEIRNLDAQNAGALFHSGGGWARIEVGEARRLGRFWRHNEWLVVGVPRHPSPSEWVVQATIAALWALLGFGLACPPHLRFKQVATFGGRLRLLVAGGVVCPLAVLTLFMHLRFQREASRLEQLSGLDALHAARYTVSHLGGGVEVNDDLARWLAAGWGGEVVLFDGADVIATSRRDLMKLGRLPELPVAEVFPAFLLGRGDPVVMRQQDRLVAAGAVELEGRRLLVELFRPDPAGSVGAPDAVDWLLTGAALAALIALVLTAGVERRLSVSLNDLVTLARKLLHGEPVPEIRRPKESDLAEVLDAVSSMNAEVHQRELRLRDQGEMLRITLSTLVPSVMVLESDGALRFANPSAQRLRAEHEVQVTATVLRLATQCGDDGTPVEETIKPVAGQDLTWRVGVARVPLPEGSRGLVAVVDDVSDVVRVDRLRQLAQLARIVAHEVKNPLTPSRLWVQELEEALRRGDSGLDELLHQACSEISSQVGRLQATANSFSNLVALEHWEAELIDLVDLIDDAMSGLDVLKRRGVEVTCECPEHGVCTVVGDHQWLRRALGNLIVNSIEAIGDAQAGEIILRTWRSDTAVLLEVEDSGPGVAEAQLDDLFSPHFSSTSGGSGLGLALVAQVVSRCHGRVAASNGQRGLVVRLELPAAPGR